MNFIILWFICYWLIMLAMCLDNIFWISASPEYNQFKAAGWIKYNNYIIPAGGKGYRTKLGYILKYRICSVLTNWRDIVPAIISSFFLAVILW